MTLSLKDGVFYVRTEIGELQQFLWSDDQIIFDLNHSARRMCSVAGNLTKFEKAKLGLTADEAQEAALDVEIDKVKSCKYFAGQEFNLEPMDWRNLQVGASTGSIPTSYYVKTATLEMTPQSVATSNINSIPIDAGNPNGKTYRSVVGVCPIPPTPAEIHIWYSYIHPWMEDPTDPCAVEEPFLEAWACGAIERCLRIQKAHAEAALYRQRHDDGTEKFRLYAASQKQSNKPARYGNVVEPWRRNASSSVIFVDPFPQGP